MKRIVILGFLILFVINIMIPYSYYNSSSYSVSNIQNYTNKLSTNLHEYLPPAKGNISLSNKFEPEGVNVYAAYSSEPAPMGIADYGIGPNGPFVRSTTQFLGKIYLNELSDESTLNNHEVSFQLNVVLNYNYNGYNYALWVQDVAFFNSSNDFMYFENNIWNFSAYKANVTNLVGNGNIYLYNSQTYYAYVAWNYPGSPTTLTLPTTIYLLVNVSTNSLGQPVIYFWYNDGFGWVNYDVVRVTNVSNTNNVYFLIDGYQYTPSGNFYDAELDMVGPGDGSCAYIYSSNVEMSLEYWNGHNFQGIRNAYNFGSDTAETSNNVIDSSYYFVLRGYLIAGLHTGQGSLGPLWNQNSVSTLIVNTGIDNGYIVVYNSSYPYSSAYVEYEIPFYNDTVELTLVSMDYAVLVYNQNNQLVGEANVNAPYGSARTGVTQFNVFTVTSTTLDEGSSTSVTINLNAYGDVNLNVIVPEGISYNIQNPIYVDGQGTDVLTLYASNISQGVYTIIINASLFTGFYKTVYITLYVGQPLYTVSFSYSVIGQPLPESPQLTLDFPNGSIISLAISSTVLKLPSGTKYSVQNTIGLQNGIRWTTDNLTSGTIYGQESINIVYFEQFLVSFNYEVQGGQGYELPIITYNYFGHMIQTTPNTVWVDYDSPYSYQSILSGSNSQERWIAFSYSGIVASPGTINIYYYNEYYVNVNSPISIYAIINGTNSTLVSNWYIQGTSVKVENLTYYPSLGEREVITSISPSSFTVNSSTKINVNVITQFHVNVNSPIPLYALLNNTNVTLKSGWYNANSVIKVENLTYYPSIYERYVITNISPSSLIVDKPSTISVKTLKQYYITISSQVPLYAIINNYNTSLMSNWYNQGTKIAIENLTYYPSLGEREVITSISPSSFIVNSPTNVSASIIVQFLIKVNSQIPVKATINGSLTYLNSSWINKNSIINIENYTYYVNSEERYVITNITPQSVTLTKPLTFTIGAQKQYSVKINGILNWYNAGSKIYLNASVPFYDNGEFKGTYDVLPGSPITVNGPIQENLVETPNYVVVGSIFTAASAAIIVALLFIVMRKKTKK
ncbi:thermopsin [Acidianus brierleyi]|uniref:Thermopsin n=1 Tax=Acidianus brierleyi TaxID=41673 RepID=A0A2U9IH26_9CREN|nr:thermopsin [Acidianus brierleyi]AWR95347.1 hypothetical protein DFR85_12825 [Acidianus brierleyi]